MPPRRATRGAATVRGGLTRGVGTRANPITNQTEPEVPINGPGPVTGGSNPGPALGAGNANQGTIPVVEANQGPQNPDMTTAVTQHLVAAIPTMVAQITASMNANNPNGENTTPTNAQEHPVVPPRGCSYAEFTKCKPKEFYGTEGAVGLINWLESIEATLYMSKCTIAQKVEYASSQFQGDALSWWNGHVRVLGREIANLIPFGEFKRMLMDKYCPREEVQKMEGEFWNHTMEGLDNEKYTIRFHEYARLVPRMVDTEEKMIERYCYGLSPEVRRLVAAFRPTTLQAAVSATNQMVLDLKRTKGVSDKGKGNKRKNDGSSGSKNGGGGGNKKFKTAHNFAINTREPKPYYGPHPKCDRCSFHHAGDCLRCPNCRKLGHTARYCKEGAARSGNVRGCFECGSANHIIRNCPNRNQAPNNNDDILARNNNGGNFGGNQGENQADSG
jgi:hypothetical protein